MTVLNQESKNRKFYFSISTNTSLISSNTDANYHNKFKNIKFIYDIRKEYKESYDENFLIEAFMKVSNHESDLREYLNNPINKSGMINT